LNEKRVQVMTGQRQSWPGYGPQVLRDSLRA